ncbi:hypothetical protein CAE01nite_33510 [Cellulomonas aerilata]|uniref:YlxR domain-containing protein n=1 Tax=Cellulomonas aerilata TaxID=515326 RepID=A0A512DGS9_9CELL|nr:hypothetical protein CAE01nite_33510 [Cellulomonas aerilata]
MRSAEPGARPPSTPSPEPVTGPVRTCVGCRRTGSRSDLLRVVVTGGGSLEPALVVDAARSLPGRGAWLHPDRRCLELAERRRAFGRSLRHAGPLDPGPIGEYLEAWRG